MIQTCTIQELKEKMSEDPELFIVDCRSPEEFESGHIPKAINIPLGEDLEALEWPENEPIYVICHSGGRSLAFCAELNHLGKKAVNVKGGMRKWNR